MPRKKIERRRAPRRKREHDAWIEIGIGGKTLCRVINISTDGATLAFKGLNALPKQFLLSFSRRGASKTCNLVWRRTNIIGVKFEH
jgi:hypothetical protein